MNEKDKRLDGKSVLADMMADLLLSELPEGIERNKILVVKGCKEICEKTTSIIKECIREWDDNPAKVEKALKLVNDILALFKEFDEETEDESKTFEKLLEKLRRTGCF